MTFTRRDLLWMPLAGPLSSLAQPQNPKMNVLLIAVDDLNNRIACYGDPVVKTPNIDRLARHGVRFDRSYCNCPLCNPTRTSLLSGRRPETTQVFNNTTPPRTHLGDVVFLPEYYKAQGYFTARVGKIAHGTYEYQLKWDISESVAGVPLAGSRGLTDEDTALDRARRKQSAKRQNRAGKQAKQGDTGGGGVKLSWTPTNRADAEEPDGATARRIVQIIRENKSKPFFVGCGFHKPHLPWVAPRKYFDMYSLDQIKLPNTPADDRDDIPPLALTSTQGDAEMTGDQRRQAILAYHAATTFMDAQLGLVLDTLDQEKLWDNTVVLLFGDHGWHLYDHLQLWRKMSVFEQASRAPLVVHAPGKAEGVACPRLVEFVDIYPTLTELCGLPQSPGMQGTSFAPLLDSPQRPWKKAAYTMVARGAERFGRSVRTERYRYTEWEDGKSGVEFYDHELDPNEWTNVAWPSRTRTQQQGAQLGEMKALLHADKKTNLPPRT
ncbi:MAG: sulfatase [Acidobacteria bacterium]|nr:sulfatase [Acidobacteriota bacterium]